MILDNVTELHDIVQELNSLRPEVQQKNIVISDMVKKLRELSLQRIPSARAHTQKKKCQESEQMVFSGSGSGRTVSELADIIEGLSVEKTFKPYEAYQLCQLLSLLQACRPFACAW